MPRAVPQNSMTSFEPIISAGSAVATGSSQSGFAGEIQMGRNERKKGPWQCSFSSISSKTLRSGLLTRGNGITCTNHAKLVGVPV